MAEPNVRTTVTLPASLLASVDTMVKSGMARSRSALLAKALAREVAELERKMIDEAFAEMASDEEYQQEASAIAAEFSSADWEALQAAEQTR